MNETTTPTDALVPVEEQIQQELVKHNVTEAKIAELKAKYLPLQIKDTSDKETYLVVKEARKECKALRILAEKLCKKGREDAVKIQKAWVAKENDIAGRIGEVEDHLEKQEKEFEAAEKAEKERRKRQQDEQLIMRQQILTGMGVLYSDGKFALGEASFEMSMIRECEQEIWEADILPHFKSEYEKVQAERIEQERIKQEREAQMKRQEEELKAKQLELAAKEAELLKTQEEQERKEREEKGRQAAAVKAAQEAKENARMDQLCALGLKFDFNDNHFKGYGCFVPILDIQFHDDEKWDAMMEKMTTHVAEKKQEQEQQRLAEIESQKEAERKTVLGQARLKALKELGRVPVDATAIGLSDLSEEEFDTLYANEKREYEAAKRMMWEHEQEEKRIQELGISRMQIAKRYNAEVLMSVLALGKLDEASFEMLRGNWQTALELREEEKRKTDMEAAKDKEKWQEMMRQVNTIEVFPMRSSQYRRKASVFNGLLEQLKALDNG